MNRQLAPPFQAIDNALAERISAWHQSHDPMLWQTTAATSFALQQGHTCLALEQCLQEAPYHEMQPLNGSAFPPLDALLAHLQQFDLSPEGSSPLVLDRQRVYLRRYWQFEVNVAHFFHDRSANPLALDGHQIKVAQDAISELFPQRGSDTDWQLVAALNCLFDSAHLIIGGPGTGKTYTVTRILALQLSIAERPLTIRLAAPTGKAAQRLAESVRQAKQQIAADSSVLAVIPDEALTIHRLLGVIPNSLHFRHHKENPLDADILVVDEVSMVDLPLMARLLDAVKPTTQVILLGDADQLPAVAAGSIVGDLSVRPHPGYSFARTEKLRAIAPHLALNGVTEGCDYLTELKVSRRFAGQSAIGVLAKHVIAGNYKLSEESFEQFDELAWLDENKLWQQLNSTNSQYFASLAKQPSLDDAFGLMRRFRILCAVRESDAGVIEINRRIAQRINPGQARFYHGQPIMVTQNHYGLKLFNGDVGIVWSETGKPLMAWFESDTEYRPVALGRLPQVETVYAMTIHKTQGSEFDEVLMILPTKPHPLITRELLFTGLTRAKQKFSCLGSKECWRAGVRARVQRWAGLRERIMMVE